MGRIRRFWSMIAGKPRAQQSPNHQSDSHVASPTAEPKNPTTSVLVVGAGKNQ